MLTMCHVTAFDSKYHVQELMYVLHYFNSQASEIFLTGILGDVDATNP